MNPRSGPVSFHGNTNLKISDLCFRNNASTAAMRLFTTERFPKKEQDWLQSGSLFGRRPANPSRAARLRKVAQGWR
jgi:hypothetical protein